MRGCPLPVVMTTRTTRGQCLGSKCERPEHPSPTSSHFCSCSTAHSNREMDAGAGLRFRRRWLGLGTRRPPAAPRPRPRPAAYDLVRLSRLEPGADRRSAPTRPSGARRGVRGRFFSTPLVAQRLGAERWQLGDCPRHRAPLAASGQSPGAAPRTKLTSSSATRGGRRLRPRAARRQGGSDGGGLHAVGWWPSTSACPVRWSACMRGWGARS